MLGSFSFSTMTHHAPLLPQLGNLVFNRAHVPDFSLKKNKAPQRQEV
jgi:hypothetical protein